MTIIQIRNRAGEKEGTFNDDNFTYYKTVFKNQMFPHMITLNQYVLRKLAKLKCQRFCFELPDFYNEPCKVYIGFIQFLLNREDLNQKKGNNEKMYGARLKHWTIMHQDQKTIGYTSLDIESGKEK